MLGGGKPSRSHSLTPGCCGVVYHTKSRTSAPAAERINATKRVLTSDQDDGHHQLEDAVDEREGEHDLQLGGAEGQLGDGAAQLGVLETRLQGDGPSPGGGGGNSQSLVDLSHYR